MCVSVEDEDIINVFWCPNIFKRMDCFVGMEQRRPGGLRRRRGSQSKLLRAHGHTAGYYIDLKINICQ